MKSIAEIHENIVSQKFGAIWYKDMYIHTHAHAHTHKYTCVHTQSHTDRHRQTDRHTHRDAQTYSYIMYIAMYTYILHTYIIYAIL